MRRNGLSFSGLTCRAPCLVRPTGKSRLARQLIPSQGSMTHACPINTGVDNPQGLDSNRFECTSEHGQFFTRSNRLIVSTSAVLPPLQPTLCGIICMTQPLLLTANVQSCTLLLPRVLSVHTVAPIINLFSSLELQACQYRPLRTFTS